MAEMNSNESAGYELYGENMEKNSRGFKTTELYVPENDLSLIRSLTPDELMFALCGETSNTFSGFLHYGKSELYINNELKETEYLYFKTYIALDFLKWASDTGQYTKAPVRGADHVFTYEGIISEEDGGEDYTYEMCCRICHSSENKLRAKMLKNYLRYRERELNKKNG